MAKISTNSPVSASVVGVELTAWQKRQAEVSASLGKVSAELKAVDNLQMNSIGYLAAKEALRDYQGSKAEVKAKMAKDAIMGLLEFDQVWKVDPEAEWHLGDTNLTTGLDAVKACMDWVTGKVAGYPGFGRIKYAIALHTYLKASDGRMPAIGELQKL